MDIEFANSSYGAGDAHIDWKKESRSFQNDDDDDSVSGKVLFIYVETVLLGSVEEVEWINHFVVTIYTVIVLENRAKNK
jgi:hypothetical protein